MALPVYYNSDKWIDAHREEFLPPVCTRAMHDGQLKVVYVGGPNVREDFHIEEGEEFFYMVKGDMILRIFHLGKFHDVQIKEGQVFLLPPRTAHSPQRFEGTIGLLIERERKSSELDCIRWFVRDSSEVLFERWCHVENLGSSIATVIQEFRTTEQYKTGKPSADPVSKPPFQLNTNPLPTPFSLQQWLIDNQKEITEKGYKDLFHTNQTKVTIYGDGPFDSFTDLYEIFVWQLRGKRQFTIGSKHYDLQEGDTLLIPSDVDFKSVSSNNCLTFSAQMKPKTN